MNRDNFYGPSGGGITAPNNVDISQRTAEGPGNTDWAAKAMRVLRRSPELAGMPALQDKVMSKRLSDLLSDAEAGQGTTPEEDSLLRQETPPAADDPIIRMLKEKFPHGFWNVGNNKVAAYQHIWGDPKSESRLRAVLADGDGAVKEQPQDSVEKPFSSNEFWSNPEEIKRAGRAVRPPKL